MGGETPGARSKRTRPPVSGFWLFSFIESRVAVF